MYRVRREDEDVCTCTVAYCMSVRVPGTVLYPCTSTQYTVYECRVELLVAASVTGNDSSHGSQPTGKPNENGVVKYFTLLFHFGLSRLGPRSKKRAAVPFSHCTVNFGCATNLGSRRGRRTCSGVWLENRSRVGAGRRCTAFSTAVW